MKEYARYKTLLKLVKLRGLGFAQTNDWEGSKAHFLQMRKEKLVDYENGTDPRVERLNKYRPYGTDRNAIFYTITIKGLSLLQQLYPEDDDVRGFSRMLIEGVLERDEFLTKEYKLRK